MLFEIIKVNSRYKRLKNNVSRETLKYTQFENKTYKVYDLELKMLYQNVLDNIRDRAQIIYFWNREVNVSRETLIVSKWRLNLI